MEKHQEDFESVFEGMSFSNIDCKGFPDSVTISNGKDLYNFETRDYVPLEAVEELVDKATPKKAIESEMRGFSKEVASYLHCPNCDMPICNVWNRREYKPNYCHYCGQRLDWGGNDEK